MGDSRVKADIARVGDYVGCQKSYYNDEGELIKLKPEWLRVVSGEHYNTKTRTVGTATLLIKTFSRGRKYEAEQWRLYERDCRSMHFQILGIRESKDDLQYSKDDWFGKEAKTFFDVQDNLVAKPKAVAASPGKNISLAVGSRVRVIETGKEGTIIRFDEDDDPTTTLDEGGEAYLCREEVKLVGTERRRLVRDNFTPAFRKLADEIVRANQ